MGELIATISRLSITDRIRLVQEILSTISEEAKGQDDFTLTEEQWTEIRKRSDSITDGTAKTRSWDLIEAELIKRYELQP